MKCALEIATAIEARKEAERIAEEERKRKEFEARMEEFKSNIKKIDDYVEKMLLASRNGCVELLYDFCPCSRDFCRFTEKDYKSYPQNTNPYWYENHMTPEFHLGVYIKYLEEHCFKVETIAEPYTATSSTGRSYRTMEGKKLRISI
jgi:hypothetical protein